jgi:16S rRNA (guanine527-N7)-methyltransferase
MRGRPSVPDVTPDAAAFRAKWNVSRETLERLDAYVALLRKWNGRINLVSPRSMGTVWQRHIADSAQLHALWSGAGRLWADLGSGGGLPGLVVAIIAAEVAPALRVALVESDERKTVFLAEAARSCDVEVRLIRERIEQAAPIGSDVISARALAPLTDLLAYAETHRAPDGICLFPKGEAVHTEIDKARTEWRFEPRLHASRTNPGSFIVEVGDFERV